MIGSIEWGSEEERARRHREKASTIHGWVVKMRGTFFGSESTRRAGIREMREAAAVRKYQKEHPERIRGGRSGGGGLLWIFPRRNTGAGEHHPTHHEHREHRGERRHGSHRDDRHRDRDRDRDRHRHDRDHDRRDRHHRHHGSNAYHGEQNPGPWLHFHPRVKPHYHGHGTFMAGVLTGKQHLRDEGRRLKERAQKERRRERRRRKRQRRDEALAIKIDSTVNKHSWWR